MAWTTNDIMNYYKYQLRKNQAGGVSAGDFFNAWNSEQSALHSDLLGRWQAKSNSKEGANTGLIENETIMTKLAPFTQTTVLPVAAGQLTKPTDFIYTLALRINGAKVFQVDHDSLWAVNQDVIDPPSIPDNSYYYTEYQNYYSILPASVTTATLDYIQTVRDIVWDFTFDGAGRQVYNAAGSVQPQWDQDTIIEITRRSLNSLGVSFKDEDFTQFGERTIQTGNG
jgi:hypothetical protein